MKVECSSITSIKLIVVLIKNYRSMIETENYLERTVENEKKERAAFKYHLEATLHLEQLH